MLDPCKAAGSGFGGTLLAMFLIAFMPLLLFVLCLVLLNAILNELLKLKAATRPPTGSVPRTFTVTIRQLPPER